MRPQYATGPSREGSQPCASTGSRAATTRRHRDAGAFNTWTWGQFLRPSGMASAQATRSQSVANQPMHVKSVQRLSRVKPKAIQAVLWNQFQAQRQPANKRSGRFNLHKASFRAGSSSGLTDLGHFVSRPRRGGEAGPAPPLESQHL